MELRRSGIEAVGDTPWGTHFCQFYASSEDLAEILVPYFRAGLEHDEHCVWVTSSAGEVGAAWQALAAGVPDLDGYRDRRRMEVIPQTYVRDGRVDVDGALQSWAQQLEEALARGCEGLRVSGDTLWLDHPSWRTFTEYEAAVSSGIGEQRMLALCTYSLERCAAAEVADVVRNHEFALLKRRGVWERIESYDVGERRRAEAERERLVAELRRAWGHSEARYRTLFETMRDAWVEVAMDGHILEFNDVFSQMLGYSREEVGALTYQRITPERWHAFEERIVSEQVLARGYSELYEKEYRRKDGTVFPVELRTILARDAAGRPAAMRAIVRDISDRKRAEAERERHLAAIEEANEAKDLFFNTLSHELRTPLAAMLNALELLRHEHATEAQRARAFSILDRNLHNQTRLIEDLLDLSRIMRGKVELSLAALDLRDVVSAQVEALEGAARQAQLSLTVELGRRPVPVRGDPLRLGQVLSNLLTNAVKFTEPGGRISVRVAAAGDEAVVSVRDTGIGIPADLLPRVFEPFRQAETSLARSKGGLGIGLAVARSLVQLHGGSLTAESDGPGKGSELTLRLPLQAEAAPPAPAPRVDEASSPRGRRVLLIEDNADLRESLVMLLELAGHAPTAAADGRVGLELARTARPDVVLIDIGLPGIDGYQVAGTLRRDPATRSLPLVALTGYATPEHQERARLAGFTRHLVKPVDPEELLRVVEANSPGFVQPAGREMMASTPGA